MDSQIFQLVHTQARRNAAQACMTAPDGMVAQIKPRTRSGDQNRLLHSIFGEVAKAKEFNGRRLTATQWKTLFISGHAIATGLGADMMPGLENEFVNVRESSAQMSVARMTSLIEYILAWCAEHDVAVNRTVPA